MSVKHGNGNVGMYLSVFNTFENSFRFQVLLFEYRILNYVADYKIGRIGNIVGFHV